MGIITPVFTRAIGISRYSEGGSGNCPLRRGGKAYRNRVRNCDIYNVYYGVFVNWETSHENLIEDNNFYNDPGLKNWPWGKN